MVRCIAVVLLFEERVGQYQLMLDCPVPEPLSSAVLSTKGVSSIIFGVNAVLLVVRSHSAFEVSSIKSVCFGLPASVGVFWELRVYLLYVFVSTSRAWDVD